MVVSIFFSCSPLFGEDYHFDYIICFQMGWFNHQLVILLAEKNIHHSPRWKCFVFFFQRFDSRFETTTWCRVVFIAAALIQPDRPPKKATVRRTAPPMSDLWAFYFLVGGHGEVQFGGEYEC